MVFEDTLKEYWRLVYVSPVARNFKEMATVRPTERAVLPQNRFGF